MKRAHLSVVQNGKSQETIRFSSPAAAKIDWKAFRNQFFYWFGLLRLVVLAPFKLIAFLGRSAVAVGCWLYSAIIYTFLGLIGAAFVFFLVYGFGHFLFYPLFH